MAQLKLYFLGSPRIELAGAAVECDSRKGLAMLAYLAVTDQSHSRDALSTLLWPDHDQSRARSYLRHALWALKKNLGDGWLEISREQVGLNPEADIWLDVAEFQQRLKTTPNFQDTISLDALAPATEAVELYRGDFLAGFTLPDAPDFDEWQFFQTEELREKLAGVLERLVWGYSGRRDYGTALPYGRRWVGLDPLHEPAQCALMQLYAEAGQQAAALRQYEQYVELLDKELGLPPEEKTTTLYEAIKARRFIEPLLKAESPGNGEAELTPGVDLLTLALGRPSGPAARIEPKHNLPAYPTPFIGREKELDEINRLLLTEPACRLLTLVGLGGIGKTRLAIQAARRLIDSPAGQQSFAHGTVFVSLAGISAADGIVSAIAEAAGLTFYNDLPASQQLLDYLSRKKMLLVLDNFEHLLTPEQRAESLALLSHILTGAPAIKLLVTSREGLNLQEAWFQRVTGLSLPGDDASSALPANRYDAVGLFEQNARRARPNFSLDIEQEDVIRICRLVEGMPLAIELAAAWLKALPLKNVAHEIERNLDILTAQYQNLPERHRSMRAVLEQSWAMLNEAERQVFKRLAVFRGGFRQEAAVYVAGASLITLLSLVDKSWLRLTNTGRYVLHELLRQFAAEKFAETPEERRTTTARHADYFMAFLGQRANDINGKNQKAVLAEIRADMENLRAAWTSVVENGPLETLDPVLDTAFDFYWISSLFQEGAAVFGAVVNAAWPAEMPAASVVVIAKARARLGAYFTALGRYHQAREQLHQSLSLARKLDIRREEAFILNILGEASRMAGEYPEAQRLFQASLEISRGINHQPGMALSLLKLAWGVEEEQGDCLQARQYLQQALDLYRASGRRADVAFCLDKLAHNAWKLGHYAESERLHRESLAIFREINDQLGIANNLGGLGLIALSQGKTKLEEAKALLEESLRVCRETGHLREEANRLRMLTLHAIAAADYDQANVYGRETLALAERIGYDHGVMISLVDLAEAALGQGDFKACRDYLMQAMRHSLEKSKQVEMTDALTIWAMLLMAESQFAPAGSLEKLEQAVEILSLVISHPAAWQFYKDKATAVMTELAGRLPPDRVAAAQARGQNRPWTEVVTEIVH